MDFAQTRVGLRSIREQLGEGYLVSLAWDGSLLSLIIGRVAAPGAEWRKPWVMTFDSEDDYSLDPDALIARIVTEAKVWFGSSREQADEIVRLLKLAEAK